MPTIISDDDVLAGQAVYTRRMLAAYDLAVLGFNCRFLWRCPARRMLELYNENVSANHLDVGVGSGYFLDHARFPVPRPRLGLLDLNRNSLDFTAQRLVRYQPELFQANVLAPIELDAADFDSVGMNFLLHCLPGSMTEKVVAFDHLRPLMNPGGVLFGATILASGVKVAWAARQMMRRLNARRIFSNERDTLDDLRSELKRRFAAVAIEVVGCVALFSGRA